MNTKSKKFPLHRILQGCLFFLSCLSVVEAQTSLVIHEKATAWHFQTHSAFALFGKPKYGASFTHFDYVCPNAPKGGTLRLAVTGSYDNFNPFALRGMAETRSAELYETLFIMSEDENSSYYPLLAQEVRLEPSYKSAVIILNPQARFHDGVPITARDVLFSFEKFRSEGIPQYQQFLKGITVTQLSLHRIKIVFDKPNREKLISFLSNLKILPKHIWQHLPLTEPLAAPPVGSGPYRVSDYKPGEYAIYKRVTSYWGKDLPINLGQHNFDYIRQEYYLDDSIALEAFKASAFDVRQETQPQRWHTQYQGAAFDHQRILKVSRKITTPPNTRWLAFNLNKPQWQDWRVRKAITLAFDFDWINRSFYYNCYHKVRSFFENTPYAAQEAPHTKEQALLAPFRHTLPPEIFQMPFQLPDSDQNGFNRARLQQAHSLLIQAGWGLYNQQRKQYKTGATLQFELLMPSTESFEYVLPFQHSLKQLGITMTVKRIEPAHFAVELRKRNYDMIPTLYYAYLYPSSTLRFVWGRHSLHSQWNPSGLHTPLIDKLLQQITDNQRNPEQLQILGRTLDRVLMYQYAMIPMGYPKDIYYAYRNTLHMLPKPPRYTLGIGSWWYDESKKQPECLSPIE